MSDYLDHELRLASGLKDDANAEVLAWAGTMNTWENGLYTSSPAPAPEGGESAYMAEFDRVRFGDERPQFIVIPNTAWGDYVGSVVNRSNCRSLLRDFADEVVSVRGNYGYEALYVPANALISHRLYSAIAYLATWPYYSEGDLAELEVELFNEAWESYAEVELANEVAAIIVGEGNDACMADEIVKRENLLELYHAACEETGFWPYAETATGMVLYDSYQRKDIPEWIAARIMRGYMTPAVSPDQATII